ELQRGREGMERPDHLPAQSRRGQRGQELRNPGREARRHSADDHRPRARDPLDAGAEGARSRRRNAPAAGAGEAVGALRRTRTTGARRAARARCGGADANPGIEHACASEGVVRLTTTNPDILGIGITGRTLTDLERSIISETSPYAVVLFGRNIESDEQLRELVSECKRIAKRPPLMMIDEEGGRVDRLRNLVPGL